MTRNFDKYKQVTKFKEDEIKDIYNYFNTYSKNKVNMNLLEFRNSLGVLGSKSSDWICRRMYNLILEKSDTVTFDNYLSFMNLLNHGNLEEKLKHSFNFFDISGNGVIVKADFCTVIFKLCEFFSKVSMSTLNLKEKDIELIYDEMLKKLEVKDLTLKSFINMSSNYPEFMDYFDIFNNKVVKNLNLSIQRDQLNKLDDCLSYIRTLIKEIEDAHESNVVSLTMKDYFEKLLKDAKTGNLLNDSFLSEKPQQPKKLPQPGYQNQSQPQPLFKKNIAPTNTKFTSINEGIDFNNQSLEPLTMTDEEEFLTDVDNQNKETEKSNKDNFQIDKNNNDKDKENNKDNNRDNNKDNNRDNDKLGKLESLKEKETIKERDQERKNSTFDYAKLNYSKTYKFPENDLERFEFIRPTTIDDPELREAFNRQGINAKNCLIIKNCDSFLTHLCSIRELLTKTLIEIDPIRQQVRRKGFSVEVGKGLINKEMFLNTQNVGEPEKGLIHFGNKNVEMVLSMMIGIRNAVTSLGESEKLYNFDQDDDAFMDVNLFDYTQKSYDKEVKCEFYDYAPKVFYNIRKMYGIKNEEYDKSLGPENFLGNLILPKNRCLKELVSAGKSGSFFYFSYDSKFVLKTIPKHEFEFFKSIIKDYYFHFYNNPQTMMQRYIALHTMVYNKTTMHFVIMNNVFNSGLKVHLKYDLKGSSYQRQALDPKEKNYDKFNFSIPMKDLDFKFRKEKVLLLKEEKDMIIKEIENDSKFLASLNINDYSFLIGIHDPDNGSMDMIKEQIMEKSTTTKVSKTFSDIELQDFEFLRRPFFEKYKGGIKSSDGKKVYFFGIIDLFTSYGTNKKCEHFWKSISQGPGISCQPPPDYSKRFILAMKNVLSD